VKIRDIEALWLGERREFSLGELCELSGCTEHEIRELIDYGVLAPLREAAPTPVFSGLHLMIARTARRLGRDLELEPHGVALMIELLDRIRELEAQVRDLHARLPDES